MRLGVRVEQNPYVQGALTVFVAGVMATVLLWNIPPGPPRDQLRPTVGPVMHSLALEQDWALFAPDPRGFTVGVFATVTFRDGHTERWVPPHNGLLLAPYRTYRWQKYVERVRADDYQGLWEPTARWVARQAGGDVTKVVLTRTFQQAKAPGAKGPRTPAGSFDFYTLELP
jgi:hypothetical protein